MIGNDKDLPADGAAEVGDDVDDIYAQEALWKS